MPSSYFHRQPTSASVRPLPQNRGGTYGTLSRRAQPGLNSASAGGYYNAASSAYGQRPQTIGWAQRPGPMGIQGALQQPLGSIPKPQMGGIASGFFPWGNQGINQGQNQIYYGQLPDEDQLGNGIYQAVFGQRGYPNWRNWRMG